MIQKKVGDDLNRKWYYLIGGLSVAVLATAVVFAVVNIYLPKGPEDGLLNGDSNEHEAITILGDMDFEDYDFLGNGTENNPYIIENYNITTTEDHAIYISQTTKYFIIRNCILNAKDYGIYIGDITSGTAEITQNICDNHQYSGIYLTDSSGISISSNICNDNSDGISLVDSSHTILTNNTCNNNNDWIGIYLRFSNNAILINNTCSNNYEGIRFYHSSNTILTENICENNIQFGIYLESGSNLTLINNTCNNNKLGIATDFSSNLTFTNNTCINNNIGIFLGPTFISTLINNTCNDNSIGIWVDFYSENATITYNTLNTNVQGMKMMGCNYCIVSSNYFIENINYSIYIISNTENNTIYHNSFIDNNLGGTSQACDDGLNNIWYDNKTNEGNYWSDWIGIGDYDIAGSAAIVDPYPLSSPPVT